jgi:hypothetical protein
MSDEGLTWDEGTALLAQVQEQLLAKGVRLSVGACGCCTSPWVRFEIDGVIMPMLEGHNINMFEDEEG